MNMGLAVGIVLGVALTNCKALRQHDLTDPTSGSVDNPQNATQKTVEFYEELVTKNSQGAFELQKLASAYLQRSRENGNLKDVRQAEAAARRSLVVREQHNLAAFHTLARSLLTQHRFSEALKVVDISLQRDPRNKQSLPLLFDIQCALGSYDQAEMALRQIEAAPGDPTYSIVWARWHELTGDWPKAVSLLREAEKQAQSNPGLSRETVAWVYFLVGHALAHHGNIKDAKKLYEKALAVFPQDYRAMTELAELAAWQDDWKVAVPWAEKALAISPENHEAITILAEAHAALGQNQMAEEQYKRLEQLFRTDALLYDRQRSQEYAKREIHLDEALALAQRDVERRKDIYAYDTLAWALYKKGQLKAAEEAMDKALALGTQDAGLFLHAGSIAKSLGDSTRAQEYFTKSSVLNPYYKKL